MTDPDTGFIADSSPLETNAWIATGFSSVTQTMFVSVICAPAHTTTQ